MNLIQIIQNEYIAIIAGGLGGIITAWLTQRILNKRGVFSYFVNHLRVGMSAEDAIFGSVAVSWNGNPIPNLFLSSIELTNESMNDYENVAVCAYTSDTQLLSEQTQIVDTPNILSWSDKYKQQLHVDPGQAATDSQLQIYYGQREYVIPIMNRGQKVKITYLNSAKSTENPNIFLSISQKGVKLKYCTPQNQIFGVPQPHAALAGLLVGVVVVISLVLFAANTWVAAIGAFSYGLIAQIPGAYSIKFIRKAREAIGG